MNYAQRHKKSSAPCRGLQRSILMGLMASLILRCAEEKKSDDNSGRSPAVNYSNMATTNSYPQQPYNVNTVPTYPTVLTDGSDMQIKVNGNPVTLINVVPKQAVTWVFTASSPANANLQFIVYEAEVANQPSGMQITGNNTSAVNIAWTPAAKETASTGVVQLTVRNMTQCAALNAAAQATAVPTAVASATAGATATPTPAPTVTPATYDCNNFTTAVTGAEMSRAVQWTTQQGTGPNSGGGSGGGSGVGGVITLALLGAGLGALGSGSMSGALSGAMSLISTSPMQGGGWMGGGTMPYGNMNMMPYNTMTMPYYNNMTTPTMPYYNNMTTPTMPYYNNMTTPTMPYYNNMTTPTMPYYNNMTTPTMPYYNNMTTPTMPYYNNMTTPTMPYNNMNY